MKISLPNSRRCSTASWLAIAALLVLSALYYTPAFASAIPAVSQKTLLKDINASSSSQSFSTLLSQWEHKHGTEAVKPLLGIAKNKHNSDRARYIAIMGAAKLGGTSTANDIVPLLKDKTWMIRTASLRALSALKDPKTAEHVLPLLHDPALVVRLEAVESVRELRPLGASKALLKALQSKENYHHGRAQWVPQRALSALVILNDPSVVRELKPLLDHNKDPDLQLKAVMAMEQLSGQKAGADLPLPQRIAKLKTSLNTQTN